MPLYVQAMTVLALHHLKYPCSVENRKKPSFKCDYSFLDELYLTELIVISPSDSLFWLKLIEANYRKVCVYYDSIVGKPFNELKIKLDVLPRLASFASIIMPDDPRLKKMISYYT